MTVKIGDVLSVDPTAGDIPNEGVANVDQDKTLRWELQNFVCEGHYERGLDRILRTYLANFGSEQQPGVWVSGFYGSGKSHLVKVLTHLWVDTQLPDGASARGLTKLPPEVCDSLRELSTAGKRGAGLFAAAGHLQFARPIRRELLAILFRSAGIPEDFPLASCYLWLRDEGILDQVRAGLAARGKDFLRELRSMYVSPTFADAVLDALPGYGSSAAEVRAALKAQFPPLDQDARLTDEQMLDAIERLLQVDGEMPCCLVVLDELQQYIGDSGERALDVQLVAEACTKHFGDRILFVGTGQAALTATPVLQKIKDRFSLPVELADTDVEKVTRRIVLAKKPDYKRPVEEILTQASGEIDRQLRGTVIGPRHEDREILLADYPILPVRRRFWEKVLRAVDTAGTTGQLRTQLRIAHEAVRSLADRPLGAIVPADFIYDQQATGLVQTGVLLRDTHELIASLREETPDGELKASLCALCWLIGKLPRDESSDCGVRATSDMLADLLVDDLRAGNATLRQRVPELLDQLAAKGHLMRVGDEYHIQTREGAAWTAEFQTQYAAVVNDAGRIADERSKLLRQRCGQELQSVRLIHGSSKVPRQLELNFSSDAPTAEGDAIPVWIRDGWGDSDKSVLNDARQAGPESPVVFVFLPRHSSDDLRESIAQCKAAEATLALKGVPTTSEGLEARAAMETRERQQRLRVEGFISEIIDEARVFQGGGSEVTALALRSAVEQAADHALVRLYPEFPTADSARWAEVVKRARAGDGDCLSALGHQGEVADHPVCKAVEDFIGAGKKGREVRSHFMASPYGWSQDAVDGAIGALILAERISARENGQGLTPKALDQTKIGVADFRRETSILTVQERIALRALLQAADIPCRTGEEVVALPQLLSLMQQLAEDAGGDPPAPAKPDVVHIEDLSRLVGNELGVAVYEKREQLSEEMAQWRGRAQRIAERVPLWQALQTLLRHAGSLPVAAEVAAQAEALREDRRLIDDPDPVKPLCDRLTDALRDSLNAAFDRHESVRQAGFAELQASDQWAKLTDPQRSEIISEERLLVPERPAVATEDELIESLNQTSLAEWESRVQALPQRVSNALLAAAKLLEPEAVPVRLPSRTISTPEGVEAYIAEVREMLLKQINSGKPVVIR